MSKPQHVLDPLERLSEVLFGLIMALTFTGSLSVASAGHEEVRTMLIGAIGCNLAWGIVDGVMYLLFNGITRARELNTLKSMRAAADPDAGRQILAEAMPPLVASVLRASDLERLRQELLAARELPARPLPNREDLRGAVGVLLLVFLSTFPLVIPFFFIDAPRPALRVSNAVAVAMLFLTGHQLGKYAKYHPIRLGLMMVAIGIVLVGLTIALGG